uniref:Chitin synthase n=1 Tax=Meloidogyne artiellia TaxID=42426 RepID=CHS_MELAT|nr:RecName: Full=Chitin synthase; AltName: Full=Chitin-UDP acetyl-glucosaminyl transferase [Meloidogyne artiellia]AAG40111.1 chitin synthase [Meloidogyne artiellia]
MQYHQHQHQFPGPGPSHTSVYSSDGFSCSMESIPLPEHLQQRNPPMEEHYLQQTILPTRVPESTVAKAREIVLSHITSQEHLPWDTFRLLPPKADRHQKDTLYNGFLQVLKMITFVALFVTTLGSSILAKLSLLVMAAGLGQAGHNISICPDKIPESPKNSVLISPKNAAKWAWALLLAICIPELLCFARSLHRSLFRKVRGPSFLQFLLVFTVESVHAFGLGALVFAIMPRGMVITMLQLGNSLCLIPSLLLPLSRSRSRWLPLLLLLDGSAILAQSSAAIWRGSIPLERFGFVFLCTSLISIAWWQNFVHPHSFLPATRFFAHYAAKLRECRSKTFVVLSPWKCLIFTFCMFQFVPPQIPFRELLQKDPFGEKLVTINAYNLNQSQLNAFQERMENLERKAFHQQHPHIVHPLKLNRKIVENIANGEAALFRNGTRRPPKKEEVKKNKMDSKKKTKKLKKKKGGNNNATSTNSSEKTPTKGGVLPTKRERRTMAATGSNERVEADYSSNSDADEQEEEEENVAAYNIYDDRVELNQFTTANDALWLVFVQAGSVLLCQLCAKFACKVVMQRVGLALPVVLSIPFGILFLAYSCRQKATNPCHLSEWMSKELFWQCPTRPFHWQRFFREQPNLLWLCWWLSQCWITIHLWLPRQERLAKSEKLFVLGYIDAPFPEHSIALDRRRDDKIQIRSEDIDTEEEANEGGGEQEDGNSSTHTCESAASGLVVVEAPFPKHPNVGRPTAASICSNGSLSSGSHRSDDGGLIRELPSSADSVCKIYVCATMWHESALEMGCMLKSIFRLDKDQCARRNAQRYLKVVDPDYYVFEAHIYIDDAFELDENGNPHPNKFVHQLLEKMDEAASTKLQLRTPRICVTSYGGRISYVLPWRNRLSIHLKNKLLIRQRKRWSQVMYLYFLLGFRLMLRVHEQKRRELLAENTFILTLDGDVDFQPECVHLLVDLMRKNRRLGAACGRIHPRGSGLMVWYQKFEYAVGHWLQKATEHMIGCVLCSPGCFSLFRSSALIDDNVARKYATKSEKPFHYVQYDQGEDRWLCTLLLQRGYRVEYCAASDALTFAPEGFSEFFNQRRRWIPSTMANVIDLLRDYRNVVRVNDSVSIWYIAYQLVMLFSSVLGPGTIFLMIVGAISISFNIDTRLALLIVTTPVLCFCVCCLTCGTETQLLLAQVIGALFAMLMTAVIVGTSLQIQKDGLLSPHSIFLFTVLGSWSFSALLHPLEFGCLLPCGLYFLAIPCMYMLLPVYSLCNLNTVSWGTRENASVSSSSTGQFSGKREERGDILPHLQKTEDGELSVGCGNFCRVVCCVRNPSSPPCADETVEVRKLDENFRKIERKLQSLERRTNGQGNNAEEEGKEEEETGKSEQERKEGREEGKEEEGKMSKRKKEEMDLKGWMELEPFRRFEPIVLDTEEESFWREMIEKYLRPILPNSNEQARIQRGLNELRNTCCSAFFMVNIVFIIVVLVLQLQKDCLHIEWPLGPLVNQTRVQCGGGGGRDFEGEEWIMSRLQLEPMGFVFIVFFLIILFIQFLAMLFHRFGTFTHIIASTELCCAQRPLDKLSEEELVAQNAVEIVRELQAIRGIDSSLSRSEQFQQQPLQRQTRQHFPRTLSLGKRQQNAQIPPRCEKGGNERGEESPTSLPAPPVINWSEVHRNHQRVQPMEGGQQFDPRKDTLDAAFRQRFFALSSSSIAADHHQNNGGHLVDTTGTGHIGAAALPLTLNRRTLRALEQRRNILYQRGDRKRIPALNQQFHSIFPSSSESEGEEGEGGGRGRGREQERDKCLEGKKEKFRQRVEEGPARCHRLEELFGKSRKGGPQKRGKVNGENMKFLGTTNKRAK